MRKILKKTSSKIKRDGVLDTIKTIDLRLLENNKLYRSFRGIKRIKNPNEVVYIPVKSQVKYKISKSFMRKNYTFFRGMILGDDWDNHKKTFIDKSDDYKAFKQRFEDEKNGKIQFITIR